MTRIRVTFRLAAILKGSQGGGMVEVEVLQGSTIEKVLRDHFEYTGSELAHLVTVLDGERVPLDKTLTEGGQVEVLLPVGGG